MKEVKETKAAVASARARCCLGDITNKLRRLSQLYLPLTTVTTRAIHVYLTSALQLSQSPTSLNRKLTLRLERLHPQYRHG